MWASQAKVLRACLLMSRVVKHQKVIETFPHTCFVHLISFFLHSVIHALHEPQSQRSGQWHMEAHDVKCAIDTLGWLSLLNSRVFINLRNSISEVKANHLWLIYHYWYYQDINLFSSVHSNSVKQFYSFSIENSSFLIAHLQGSISCMEHVI